MYVSELYVDDTAVSEPLLECGRFSSSKAAISTATTTAFATVFWVSDLLKNKLLGTIVLKQQS